MNIDLSKLTTEGRNSASAEIDMLSTEEVLRVINREDQKVALAVEKVIPAITQAVDAIVMAFQKGGRLIYCGAGTSGRLGILDASECPPTYGTPHEQVVGLIAGGHRAILQAVENAEDSLTLGVDDLRNLNFNANDVLVGIAASGRTPYVIAAMHYAKSLHATTVALTCNEGSEMTRIADIAIVPVPGAEVITGSSRMKAGTAQKLVLNMLTTGAMIRSGKVYGNLMVDVAATNQKLVQRQINIVMEATGCDRLTATEALQACKNHCKTAIVMVLGQLSAEQAAKLLQDNGGFIRQALAQAVMR
ncbi:N-acetylmuramic acid 6-phosphate etherase [Salmonella enterica]